MLLPMLSGCGILFFTGAAAGAVVVGVGGAAVDVVQGTGNAVGTGAQKTSSSVSGFFDDGVYEKDCEFSVEVLFESSRKALKQMGFKLAGGSYDALSGEVKAMTHKNKSITLWFEKESKSSTRVFILIGADGDTDKSEMICKIILDESANFAKKDAVKL
jgi:hypothetical protein